MFIIRKRNDIGDYDDESYIRILNARYFIYVEPNIVFSLIVPILFPLNDSSFLISFSNLSLFKLF